MTTYIDLISLWLIEITIQRVISNKPLLVQYVYDNSGCRF